MSSLMRRAMQRLERMRDRMHMHETGRNVRTAPETPRTTNSPMLVLNSNDRIVLDEYGRQQRADEGTSAVDSTVIEEEGLQHGDEGTSAVDSTVIEEEGLQHGDEGTSAVDSIGIEDNGRDGEGINGNGEANMDVEGRDEEREEDMGGEDRVEERTDSGGNGRADLLCEQAILEANMRKLKADLASARRRLRHAEARLASATRAESERESSQRGVKHSREVSQSIRALAEMDEDEAIMELDLLLSAHDTATSRLNVIATCLQRMSILEKVDAQVGFVRPAPSHPRDHRNHFNDDAKQNGGDDGVKQLDCVICLDALVELPILALPCAHLFHRSCISKWLRRSQVCPICISKVR